MPRTAPESASKIVPVLTMSPFTGVNHAILGAAGALTNIPPVETKPVLPEYLVREFKDVMGAYPHTMAEIAPLIAETSDILRCKLGFLDDIDPFASYVVMNPGGGARRILQSLTLKHLLPNAFLVGFNYPGWAEHLFDLTVINPSQTSRSSYPSPLLEVDAVPNHISTDKLAEARLRWRAELRSPNRPLIAVLIGGDVGKKNKTNYHPFTLDHAHELIGQIRMAAACADADVAITASRRTPDDVVALLRTETSHPESPLAKFAYFPGIDPNPNPYMGLLASADALIVTPDSMSMLSEGIDSGIPVYTVPLPGLLRKEHVQLYEFLIRNRYINELPAEICFGAGKPIRAAGVVAEAIRSLLPRVMWRSAA